MNYWFLAHDILPIWAVFGVSTVLAHQNYFLNQCVIHGECMCYTWGVHDFFSSNFWQENPHKGLLCKNKITKDHPLLDSRDESFSTNITTWKWTIYFNTVWFVCNHFSIWVNIEFLVHFFSELRYLNINIWRQIS